MPPLPSLVAFGPLAAWPTPSQLEQLRTELSRQSILAPLCTAIQNLNSLWNQLLDVEPDFSVLTEQGAAVELARQLLNSNTDVVNRDEKRNIMTMPMTIASQIVQYLLYLESSETAIGHGALLEHAACSGGVQGFCAGLLSAVAISSAHSKEEVAELAASAFQLAFCIGAFVDLDQSRTDTGIQYSNIAVRWKHTKTIDDLNLLLANHPEVYVAVIRDVRDATVTTATSHVPVLQEALTQAGFSFLDTGLKGRYHSVSNRDISGKILKVCHGRLDPRYGTESTVRSNADAKPIKLDRGLRSILDSILTQQANWNLVASTISYNMKNVSETPWVLSIGVDALPCSITKIFPMVKLRTHNFARKAPPQAMESILRNWDSIPKITPYSYPEDAIAVIGMSCKFPGADSIDEFWSLLSRGTSMLSQMPSERFDINNAPRAPEGLKFWGNFIRDIEFFDQKFFKKSAREAASMDPQQRLLLQVTYQALESSGYFADSSVPRDIGCYLGVCAVDYQSNVGCHPPTAYSSIGTLRAFLSGRLSHYFGWSGPSLTFDTACSSSAVAIHTACAALRSGDCQQAIAGGVNLFTVPSVYEDLTAAHFLSPSGATKPFDADADGYCRGEGIGVVVLKKLSDSLRDNDHILGVIAGSGINQNSNDVPITVPHSQSQSTLYQRVARQAGIVPHQLTFVEAHGTGTPVGDPIEMESIRNSFGGPQRDALLIVSSVKGNIGHLESASGVASLIKTLLQMQYRTACAQASFKSLNPKVPQLQQDSLCIPTSNTSLEGYPMTACVNNYGAAGSNSAMIVVEAPKRPEKSKSKAICNKEIATQTQRVPFQISAASVSSLKNYCRAFSEYCGKKASIANDGDVARLHQNLAFSLSRQQNQDNKYVLSTTATSIDQLVHNLNDASSQDNAIIPRPQQLPVVLCFGGQVGRHVGLSKRLWDNCDLLRSHLNHCDQELLSMGFPGLYPTIFQEEPIEDIVTLQSAIFSLQYASARAWIDSGLKVSGLVGHSLGQLAAMCISGVLTLHDGLKLVAGRASLIKRHWSAESGTMIAIDGNQETIANIIKKAEEESPNYSYEIACYNGPTAQVIVSDSSSADGLEQQLMLNSVKYRRLNVTHGFHSRFTNPLLPHLEELASSLSIRDPIIPLETCTEGASLAKITVAAIVSHTRDPVYFGQAVHRLHDRLGQCTFLEAGSHSSVVSMVRRALDRQTSVSINAIPMELNKPDSLDILAEKTVKLWNCGHKVQFWNHHRSQSSKYDVLRLPPYQFDKAKHWLNFEIPSPNVAGSLKQQLDTIIAPPPPVLLRLISSDANKYHFDIDTTSEEYRELVGGYLVFGVCECPIAVLIEIVARAGRSLDLETGNSPAHVQNLEICSPLGHAEEKSVNLELQRSATGWSFKITSRPRASSVASTVVKKCHATGYVSLERSGQVLASEFSRYERIASHKSISSVLEDRNAAYITGNMLYKIIGQSIRHADFYRNITKVASYGNKIVGKVVTPANIPDCIKNAVIHPYVLHSFLQVASVHANFIHESTEDELYWPAAIESIQIGTGYQAAMENLQSQSSWDVLCIVSSVNEELLYDIFVYCAQSLKLVAILHGARYSRSSRGSKLEAVSQPDLVGTSLVKVARQANEYEASQVKENIREADVINVHDYGNSGTQRNLVPAVDAFTAIFEDISAIVEKIADVPKNEIHRTSTFDDLGVDSLMMIEVVGDISAFFSVEIPIKDHEQLTDVDSMVTYLRGRGCGGAAGDPADSDISSTSYAMTSQASSVASFTVETPIESPMKFVPNTSGAFATAWGVSKRASIPFETFGWKRVGGLELKADVYFPKTADEPGQQRPIALMIHGGGHLLFGRQDIPMKHVRMLLRRGFLPVSIDYRLCPEVSLFEGPVTDCCDALKWARETLPTLRLSGPRVSVEPHKLIAMGWSSGGQLAMTLGYTAPARGIKPPDVILPFYAPSDLESDFWDNPIYPESAEEPPTEIWGELDCVLEQPILEYTPMSEKRTIALSFTLKDDRARLILHMNWKAQSVQVLIRGLPHKSRIQADDTTDWKKLPKPPLEKIRECSPYWHILQGTYRTPTFMVHGNADDWVPYQMSQKTIKTLQDRGVAAGVRIPDQCGHAFDLFPLVDKLGVGWAAMEEAYDFACNELAK